VEVVQVEPEQLSEDAQFKGYEEVIVQDLDFRTDNIKFRKEKYYSPGRKRTYLAQLPAGYVGQFGPGVRAWVWALYYAGGMSEPKLLELLQTVGLQISAGELSDLLIKDQEQFQAESVAVVRAGLASSPWQHLDSTGTRVNGRNEHCHVLCNPLYSAYCTLPSKDRLSLLCVLLAGADPSFRWNEEALSLLEQLGVAQKWCQQLTQRLSQEQEWKESQLDEVLDEHLPALGTKPRKLIKDALAIAAYHTQTVCPVVELFVCDDAAQFRCLTAE
jgi:hypothetical protein